MDTTPRTPSSSTTPETGTGPGTEEQPTQPLGTTTAPESTSSASSTRSSATGAEPDAEPDGLAGTRSDDADRPTLRVGTVVWGLVLAALGVGLLAIAAGAVFDVELAVITLVAVAGVALLVGSVVTGRRRRSR